MSAKINSSMITKGDTTASSIAQAHPNDIKFGVRSQFRELADKGGELVHLPHDKSIFFAIETVCRVWGFGNPVDYALKFSEPPGHYVTEDKRKDLSGKLVNMHYSPNKLCEDLTTKIKSNNEKEVVDGLKILAINAADPTVADVFVGMNGFSTLLDLIERDGKGVELQEEGFAHALQALLDIMMLSNDAGAWSKVQPGVISRVVYYINRTPQSASKVLAPALQVMESAVSLGNAYSQVDKEITLPVLITHIQKGDSRVQQNSLALMNALFQKADLPKRKSLAATIGYRKYRDVITQSVINKKPDERSSEANHELYVLQTLMLNTLDDKRTTPVDAQDPEALHKIKELFRIAFEVDNANYAAINFDAPLYSAKREKPSSKRDYQKLGFTNDSNPEFDFAQAPPGTLSLDCMYHLATSHTENYNKIILESVCRAAGDECPFARSSIALTNVLCELLKMGESPDEQQTSFYPFFFQHEKPFEELFCIGSQLITKTWKEMRATMEDFDKVFDVVREQLQRALQKIPESFDALRVQLSNLSYSEIVKIRQRERSSREEWELQAKPIQELKKKLEPEMMELIKQNRINYLIAGTRFNKFISRGLNLNKAPKFWFCRLSSNAKIFHYGECDEKATPGPEELTSKINVVDIKDLLVGKDCPHMKEKSKKFSTVLAFSVVTEKESSSTVDFIAPDKRTFDLWTDGINALLGKSMVSDAAKEDLDVLLHMEIKLRLLEVEGIELPTEAPPIPPLPDNFDFSALQINGK